MSTLSMPVVVVADRAEIAKVVHRLEEITEIDRAVVGSAAVAGVVRAVAVAARRPGAPVKVGR